MWLTIITVNYNNVQGLRRTINSVMSQTWRSFEWIIVDGGSTDGSKELIEQTALIPNANVSWWCCEKDNGVYHAMNKGIRIAHGYYLNFMNSGDCYNDSYTLQKLFGDEREYNADVIYGDWVIVNSEILTLQKAPSSISIVNLLHSNICHQAMFIKSCLLQCSPYDENYKILSDWKKWLEFLNNGFVYKYINLTICKFDGSGISQRNQILAKEEGEKILYELYPIGVLNELQNFYDMYMQPETYKIYSYIRERRLFKRLIRITLSFIDFLKKIL